MTTWALVELLAPSVGEESAQALVSRHARSSADSMTRQDALDLLDSIATEGGVVAVACRLARARLKLAR